MIDNGKSLNKQHFAFSIRLDVHYLLKYRYGLLLQIFGFAVLFSMSFVVAVLAFIIALCTLLYRYQPKIQPNIPEITSSLKGIVAFHIHPIYVVIVLYSITTGLIFSIFPVYAEGLGLMHSRLEHYFLC